MPTRSSVLERLLSHAGLIAAALFALLPITWVLSTSFKKKEHIFSTRIELIPPEPTLDNYINLFTMQDGIFWRWLMNSFLVALFTALLGVLLAATAAYALSRYRFLGRQTLMFSFLIAQMFPGAVIIIPLYQILLRLGLVGNFAGLVVAYLTFVLPFSVWMLKGFFDTIPEEPEQAAWLDGASTWQAFWYVTLPQAAPGLVVTGFFSFVNAWNEFMFAMTLMSRNENYTLPVGLRTFIHQWDTDWQLMSAATVLVTIPVLLVFFRAQRHLVGGLTLGSGK